MPAQIVRVSAQTAAQAGAQDERGTGRTAQKRETPAQRSQTAASHNLLYMAAMAHVPLPEHILEAIEPKPAAKLTQSDAAADSSLASRISVDSWLFFRQDAPALALAGPRGASYGRSQAGAVMRYRLATGSAFAPNAFVRATSSFGSLAEQDFALGVNARPLRNLPLQVHAEARLSRFANGETEIRPAAFVTAGGEQAGLPLGLAARGFAQAGYVSGKFATPFADGMLILDRRVARFDLANIRAGGGIWGGAQNGANRLDIGPSANANLRIGDIPARISLDYRFRVAGDAEPGSGAALTLSTSF
jgi:hypothetical protein